MGDKNHKKPSLPRRLLLTAGGLAALLLLIALAAKLVVVPAVVRYQLRKGLPEYWDGQATIGEIEFNFFGPSYLRDIAIGDDFGRIWAVVKEVRLDLRDWPGVHPVLTRVEVDRPQITLHFADGRCSFPAKAFSKGPKGPSRFKDYVRLESVLVRGGSLTIVAESGPKGFWGDLRFSAQRKGEDFEVSLTHGGGAEALSLGGVVNAETLEAKLHIALSRTLDRVAMAAVLAAMDVPYATGARGRVTADVDFTGRLDEPAGFEFHGTIDLADWRVLARRGRIVNNAGLSIELTGRQGRIANVRIVTDAWTAAAQAVPLRLDRERGSIIAEIEKLTVRFPGSDYGPFWSGALHGAKLRGKAVVRGRVDLPLRAGQPIRCDLQSDVDLPMVTLPAARPLIVRNVRAEKLRLTETALRVEKLSADLCGGQVRSSLSATINCGEVTSWGGGVRAENIHLPALAAALTGKDQVARGTLACEIDFLMRGVDLAGLKGRGFVFLDDADIMPSPVIAGLFRRMGLFNGHGPGASDAEAIFSMRGPIVTISRAKLANPLSALEAEPGGTVNVQTSQLNIYVVAVPIRQIRSLLASMPIVNVLIMLRDKLVRFHVTGHWSDPTITKEPVKDIAEGTASFLREMVSTGGQFHTGMLETFRNLFESLELNNDHDKR